MEAGGQAACHQCTDETLFHLYECSLLQFHANVKEHGRQDGSLKSPIHKLFLLPCKLCYIFLKCVNSVKFNCWKTIINIKCYYLIVLLNGRLLFQKLRKKTTLVRIFKINLLIPVLHFMDQELDTHLEEMNKSLCMLHPSSADKDLQSLRKNILNQLGIERMARYEIW